MRKLTTVIVLFSAILWLIGGSASAQCWPGRIGGCPTNNISRAMFGNMALVNGAGYGYQGYYGIYASGQFWKVAAINGVTGVIEQLIMSREQTKQLQILAQMANQQQPQVVVVPQQQLPQQQQPEHAFGLNYGPPSQQQPVRQQSAAPNAVAGMLADWDSQNQGQQGQQEPAYPLTNKSGFRVRLTFVDGGVTYLERDRTLKLTQGGIDRIAGIDCLVAQSSGVVEFATNFTPSEDFNSFIIVAPDTNSGRKE